MPAVPPPASSLRRRLTLLDVLCVGTNAIVGSGVFALPDDMQRAMGGYSPLAYVLCAALLAPVALCFAELSGRFDETGGPYLYARAAFGDRAGFLIGWFCWLNTFVSWAANTTLFVELCGLSTTPWSKVAAAAFAIGLGAVNYVGVKPGARLVVAVTVGKVLAIACFIAAGLFAARARELGGPLPIGLAGVGQGVYLALFPLQGFEVVPVTAGETVDARRNVPLATVGSLALSALLFVAVQALLARIYPAIDAPSDTPLVDAARYLSPALGVVVLAGSLVSIGGFTAGSALGSPRYAQAIAAHGLLPRALASIHPRYATPHVAIAATTALTAALALFFDYRGLVGMSNVTVVVQYAATCLAVPFVRRAQRGAPAPRFQVPGGALLPIVGALASIGLLAGAFVRVDGGRATVELAGARAELVFSATSLLAGLVVFTLAGRGRQGAVRS
jgi:amino acid transporter